MIITPGPVGGCGYCTTEVLALVAPSSAGAPRAGLVSGASAEPVEKLIAGSIDTKLDWRHRGRDIGQNGFVENWLQAAQLDLVSGELAGDVFSGWPRNPNLGQCWVCCG